MLRREFVIRHQMPLQHGEIFAAIQANHVIGKDRTLHRDSRFCLW
jgi:hypothetical protein